MSERSLLVLSNTTPLIALAHCRLFSLFRELYGSLLVPSAVYHEVVTEGQIRPGAQKTVTAVTIGWIQVVSLQTPAIAEHLRLSTRLGMGESEVLALAQERQANLLLIDEARGVREALSQGFSVLRTVGVLMQAKRRGYLPSIKEPLQVLQRVGFRLSEAVYQEALRRVGEIP
jgi:uncharacterized protein